MQKLRILGLVSALWLIAGCTGGAETVELDSGGPVEIIRVSVQAGSPVAEGQANAELEFSIVLSSLATTDIDVSYRTRDASATAGTDYVERAGMLTIPAGVMRASVKIPLIDDDLDEPDEGAYVDLLTVSYGQFGKASAVAMILDDDARSELRIENAEVIESDSAGRLEFPVTLNKASGFEVVVDYSTYDESSTAGEDYDSASGRLVFPPGTLARAISVPVHDDSVFEPTEQFGVLLSEPRHATLARRDAIGKIMDDDEPDILAEVFIEDSSLEEGDEGQSSMRFHVTVAPATNSEIVLDYSTVNGSARAGADYVASAGEITLPAGTTRVAIEVPVIGDTDVEADETFTVHLTAITGAWLAREVASGRIIDDDEPLPLPLLSIADSTIDEGDSGQTMMQFSVALNTASTSAVSVEFLSDDGSAKAGSDYVATAGTLEFAPGSTLATAAIPILGDTDVESDESFRVVLRNPSGARLADDSASGTIVNDDIARPSLSVADSSVAEGDSGQSDLIFTVTADRPASDEISFDFEIVSGSAESGADYEATSGKATISEGSSTTTISVVVFGDTEKEGNETLRLEISNPVNATVSNDTAIGVIRNDDEVQAAELSIANSSTDEGDSGQTNLFFTVSIAEAHPEQISVDYQTVSGTAVDGEDYVAVSGTSVIEAGETSARITVAVVGDTDVEDDETFTVALSNPVNATLAQSSAAGTIVNDDSALPSLSVTDSSIPEGDSGTSELVFTVQSNSPATDEISFDFQIVSGSAESGVDYEAAAGSRSIATGDSSTAIAVVVYGDTEAEGNETLRLEISNPVNARIANGMATGVIQNDDAVSNELSLQGSSTIEGDDGQTDLIFTLSLSAAASDDVSVDYQTVSGTAVAGEDFVATSGTARIVAGQISATVAVPVIGDTKAESDEAFTLSLSNPVNATLGAGSVTGTIQDDDDELPTLNIAGDEIVEGDSGQELLSFAVTLSAVAGSNVSFQYATQNGTATAGDDYLDSSGTATIAAGDTGIFIDVPIIGDTESEADETFNLAISNALNATIAVRNATGTILDDDEGLVSGLDARPSNSQCVAPDAPSDNASITTAAAFPRLGRLDDAVGLMRAPRDGSQWYVIEKDGRVLRFDNNPTVSRTSTFIDIRRRNDPIDVDSGGSEAGMLGMAFHPNYGNGNWKVYLSYMISGSGDFPFKSVIAEFESKDGGQTLDARDATVLLTLDQPYANHNGGQIAFGRDGYLYISFGDGGSGGDPGDRSQNTRNLFGAMLRIDVNNGSPYAIPGGNPFAGNPVCADGDGNANCPEIYAWGLRNPWKWSFDDETGRLWLGDVGQGAWEEINIIERGGNYGWRCREGAHNFNTSGRCPGGLIDPVIEYSHNVGNSITGGVVYRGNDIPQLRGRYLFADFSQGKIFASTDEGQGEYGSELLLDTSDYIAAFATEADGEVLYINYGAGEIRRIVQSGGSSSGLIPDKLSDTGCVQAGNPAAPSSGMIPYDVNAPFWSDGAAKQRWYAIPNGRTVQVDSSGDWLFPNGTVLMKHFRLNNRLIETRLFMRHTNGEWAGYTYEWNGAGTDADRVVGGKTRRISGQDWIYPSEAECLQCHTSAANFSLGIEHGQLNGDITYPSTGRTANQLVTADAIDVLAAPLPDTPDNLPRYADPANAGETLDDRARSYLHSNCAGCHRPGGPTPSDMDLRFATPLNSTGTCNVIPNSGDLGISNARIITPGNAALSVLVERTNRRDSHGMPPIGSSLIDNGGVQLLRNWVNSLSGCQ